MRTLLASALVLVSAGGAVGQGFAPAEAAKRMKLPPGFTVSVVAHEPMIRQPLSLSFDDRGRLWVLQYLQYPNPAGLKPVSQDQYLRTIWDKVPEPPPHGPKGVDRITILSDPDDQGRYRQSKDFVTGLNLASGFCLGNGGVYVVQPPYLLFYPDKNADDVPDGDPDVLLKGFGLDDTHSMANSLQWGPDGWLYGAAGSTSTCKIANPAKPQEIVEFQQGIWRYHPKTKQFELFSEGGGNTFGLDFDKHGQVIAGTNYGGFAMLHQMQGAYYVKGFSKHGPLHNPHTYGYFNHVPYKDFKGGHVTCGGIVYQGDTFPTEMHDQYIAGNLLSSAVYWHRMTRDGSTFKSTHGGDLLIANDTWHRPVDLMTGPDGSVYVADWYDKRAAHLDPLDTWDKTNGRVFKIEYANTPKVAPFDLRTKATAALIGLLGHSNSWWRREARRLLAEKADSAAVPVLRELTKERGVIALEALWTMSQLPKGLEKADADRLLKHPDEHVRAWMVRLIVDNGVAGADGLGAFAAKETSVVVRSQLACSAKRMSADAAWPIIAALVAQDDNAKDPFLPLLTWWAMERHITDANGLPREQYDRLLKDKESWRRPMMAGFLLERLAQRQTHISVAGDIVQQLLKDAPGKPERALVVKGMTAALAGRPLKEEPKALAGILFALFDEDPDDGQLLRLAVHLGDKWAGRRLLKAFETEGAANRLAALQTLTEVRHPDLPAALVAVYPQAKDAKFREAIVTAMTSYSDPKIDAFLLDKAWLKAGSAADRAAARRVLFTRPATAAQYLKLVDDKDVPVTEVSPNELRPLLQFNDKALTARIEKLYGKIGPATPGEKQARIGGVGLILNMGKGNAADGKAVFTKTCATCHQLFGEGNKIGPDLTTADRKNTSYMIANIVDPSAYVRTEYVQHEANLLDGRKVTGLVVETTPKTVTVLDAQNKKTTIARDDLEDLKPLATSMMPDKLLDTFSDQQICDLFAYLRMEPPKK